MSDDPEAEAERASFRKVGTAPAAQPPVLSPAPVIVEAERAADGTFKAKEEPASKPDSTDEVIHALVEGTTVTDKEVRELIEGSPPLPQWMKDRIARANKKAEGADIVRAENEALRKEIKALKGEDDTKPEPEKTVANVPAGVDETEYRAAESFVLTNVSTETSAELRKLPVFTENMILTMNDIADGDAKELEKVAQFMSVSAAMLAEVAKMPLRKQGAVIERAYGEFKGPKEKPEPEKKPGENKASNAPEPIGRVKSSSSPSVAGSDFKSFEERRNAEELEAGRRIW